MQTLNVSAGQPIDNFSQARKMALYKAREILPTPVIVAWKDDKNGTFAPDIPGGAGDRWHDYGESNDGRLELRVGGDYHFIFTDAAGFDEPDMNIATLEDNGERFLCLNNTCTDEDRERLGYFPGGGLGG